LSEKNKNKSTKKWLVSRMKTSGSKRERIESLNYGDTRNSKTKMNFENLPTFESMSNSSHFYNGKINTDLLKRFLRTRIGQNWNDVFSEINERIPTKLKKYLNCAYWYVADKVEIRDGQMWNLRNNSNIPTKREDLFSHWSRNYRYIEFYVDPVSNVLLKINDFQSTKITKNMSKEELRKFREIEKKKKSDKCRSNKSKSSEIKNQNDENDDRE